MVFCGAISPGIGKSETIHRRFKWDPYTTLPFDIFIGAQEIVFGLFWRDATVEHHIYVAVTRVVSLKKSRVYTQVF